MVPSWLRSKDLKRLLSSSTCSWFKDVWVRGILGPVIESEERESVRTKLPTPSIFWWARSTATWLDKPMDRWPWTVPNWWGGTSRPSGWPLSCHNKIYCKIPLYCKEIFTVKKKSNKNDICVINKHASRHNRLPSVSNPKVHSPLPIWLAYINLSLPISASISLSSSLACLCLDNNIIATHLIVFI